MQPIHLLALFVLAFIFNAKHATTAMLSKSESIDDYATILKSLGSTENLKIKVLFQRDKNKKKFTCENYELSLEQYNGFYKQKKGILSANPSNDKDASEFQTQTDAFLNEIEALAKVFGRIDESLAAAFRTNVDTCKASFKSAMQFINTLMEYNVHETLHLKSLYLNSPLVTKKVNDKKKELKLSYPQSFKKFVDKIKRYPPKSSEEKQARIETLKTFGTLFSQWKVSFETAVKKKYYEMIEKYCRKSKHREFGISYSVKTISGQTIYEVQIHLLDSSEKKFDCNGLSRNIFPKSRLPESSDQAANLLGFINDCVQDEEIRTSALIKQFANYPTDETFYFGSSFQELLEKCLSRKLPESLMKILTSRSTDLFKFSSGINQLTDRLMSFHSKMELNKHFETNLKYEDVSVRIDRMGNLIFNWNPIFDVDALEKAIYERKNTLDHPPEELRILESLKYLLTSFREFQSSYIHREMYRALKTRCGIRITQNKWEILVGLFAIIPQIITMVLIIT